MAKELYFADILKYNKTLKTLPFRLYESIQLLHDESLVTLALGFASCYTLDSHLELYISYKLAAVL